MHAVTCIMLLGGMTCVSRALQGDVHGCPYKTLEKDALAAALAKMQIAPQFVNEAVTKAKSGHFQLACAVTFEGQHGGCACETGINHPNQVRAQRIVI